MPGSWAPTLVGLGALSVACASAPPPDPRDAARAWAASIERGDVDAILPLLSERARTRHGAEGVARLARENQRELRSQAAWLGRSDVRVAVTATLTLAGDQSARLVSEDGGFRVEAAGALPTAAQTPVQALRDLRAVLRRRSYDGLLHVLTRQTRRSIESSLGALEQALIEPSTLNVRVEGRRARARLPGGHTVELEREDGVWKVKDFD